MVSHIDTSLICEECGSLLTECICNDDDIVKDTYDDSDPPFDPFDSDSDR